jgi:glycosyltransferase involved in cell wall biosynthesis
MKPDVSIIIPTFRRPEGIKRAVNSVLSQKDYQALIEIIVLDNDPDGSAKGVVQQLAASTYSAIIYGHEPNPGVANARNAAMRLAKAKLIVFLDDDEVAAPNWLAGLLDVQADTNADLVFGPVQGCVAADTAYKAYIEARFTRTGPEQSGLITRYYGCGNSLLKRAKFFNDAPVFDAETNETGGEDDALFSKALEDGAIIAWAAQALVYEEILPERATLSFSLAKAFAFGQGPSQTCWQRRKVTGVAYWMAVGLGQFALYGARYGIYVLTGNRNEQPQMLDRAVQGLGKVFWFKGFEPRFYGESAL